MGHPLNLPQTPMQSAVAATGNGAPMMVAAPSDMAYAVFTAQVTGTFTATITWEVTNGNDVTQANNTWVGLPLRNVTTQVTSLTATAAGIYRGVVSGFTQVRARVTWSSGTSVTIMGQLTPLSADLPLLSGVASSAVTDAGVSQSLTRTYTTSADMTTAAAITVAPSAGQRIYATDIIVSNGTGAAILFTLQMETSTNVLAAVRLPIDGTAVLTLRGYMMGDADAKKIFGKSSGAGNVYILAQTFSAVAS